MRKCFRRPLVDTRPRMSVTSKMMEACGETEGRLASELMQHEVQIERDVLDPLNQLTEVKTKQQKKDRITFSVDLLFWGQRSVWTPLSSLTDRDSKHSEAKKTARQVGSGLRLGQDEVSWAAFSQRNAADFAVHVMARTRLRQVVPDNQVHQPGDGSQSGFPQRRDGRGPQQSGDMQGGCGLRPGSLYQVGAMAHLAHSQDPKVRAAPAGLAPWSLTFGSPSRRTSSPQTCTALPRKREITHATTSR